MSWMTPSQTASLALATGTAGAHVPFLEEADYSETKPYVVHDVTNSKSIHAQIARPGDVDVYRIDLGEPTRIFTKTACPTARSTSSLQ